MKKKRIVLKSKLILFIIMLLILTNLSVGIPSYLLARQSLEEKGKVILSNAVEMAIDRIEVLNLGVEQGYISLETAQEQIRKYLVGPLQEDGTRVLNTPINLGDHGYFLAYNDLGVEVMHPTIEGENAYNVVTPDKEQLLVVQKQLQIGRLGGYLDYNWYYPHQKKIGRKLSYSKYESTWGWTIVATAYATDFNESADRITYSVIILFVFSLLVSLMFASNYMNRLTKPLYEVIASMKERSKGAMLIVEQPNRNDELLELINGYNEMNESIEEYTSTLVMKEKQLKRLAYIDELSQLPNLNMMEKHLENQFKTSLESGYFVLIDLKEFKIINSLYGIAFGDNLIKIIANDLRTHKPTKKSLVARLGGNEFGIWIPNENEELIMSWLTEMNDYWNRSFNLKKIETRITFTTSYVEIQESKKVFDDVLHKAFVAMQYAKAKEISLVKYTHAIYDEIEYELTLKILAEKGLENNEFYPVYQEQVSTQNNEVVGLEALARWESSELGFVSPNKFIPILNKTKLIIDFTQKLIDQIFKDYSLICEKYEKDITVSINISPLVFMTESFVSFLLETGGKYQIPTEYIILEITEDVLMDNTELVNRKIIALRQAGFKISLDDFGTGYSSLNYLQKIVLDEVKIDKSLIDDIVSDKRSRQMLHSIVEVIHNLGYNSVAEGVETSEQLEIIKRTDCKIVQGYYYSKPKRLE